MDLLQHASSQLLHLHKLSLPLEKPTLDMLKDLILKDLEEEQLMLLPRPLKLSTILRKELTRREPSGTEERLLLEPRELNWV